MPAGRLKRLNEQLLERCDFNSIQDAINTIKKRKTSIYVLPGLYEERKWGQRDRSHYCSHLGTASAKPLLSPQYIGSISTPETPEPDGQAARQGRPTKDPARPTRSASPTPTSAGAPTTST